MEEDYKETILHIKLEKPNNSTDGNKAAAVGNVLNRAGLWNKTGAAAKNTLESKEKPSGPFVTAADPYKS